MHNECDDRPASILIYNRLVKAIHRHEKLHTICALYTMYILACSGWDIVRASQKLDIELEDMRQWESEHTKALASN